MGERRDGSGPTPDEVAETELAPSSGTDDLEPLLAEIAAPPARELAAGDFIGRFEILRPIGKGGYGLVYEARDSQLGRRVAVKVVRLDRAAGSLLSLFKNEAESAAHLNHPNIVTVHDFGTHQGAPYVILELLEGETLAQRLERGPVPMGEAAEIMIQLCRGLAHAHAAGVIHRDIKPANVFLRAGGQVKILDFGLAAFLGAMETLEAGAAGSSPGAGTPAYMAPEQWRGKGEDARSDVFSAGVVLFQLLCGKLPFQISASGRSDLENPSLDGELRDKLRGVPDRLAAITLRALAPEPAARYASAAELLRALEAAAHPAPRRWPLWAALAGLLALGGALALRGRSDVHPAVAHRMVAVLGFDNLGGDASKAWIGPALAEMLSTELAAAGQLRLVSGEDVAQARKQVSPSGASLSTATLAKLRGMLGAELVITGAYVAAGDGQLRVDLRLQDTAGGETVTALAQQGTQAELVGLVVSLSQDLRARVGMGELSPTAANQVRAALPANADAAQLYAAAREKLNDRECLAAQDLLDKALAADPRLAMGHAALAAAWACLGYETRGRDEAKLAFDLSRELPQTERLWIEGQYWLLSHDYDKALFAYRQLWSLHPDDLDVGIKLVGFHEADAALAIAVLRHLPPPAGDSPRIDLAELAPAMSSEAALVPIRSAEVKARASGNRGLLAIAYVQESLVLHIMGNAVDAEQAALRAQEIAVELGNRGLLIDALAQLGAAQMDQVRLASASRNYDQAVKLCRELRYERCAFPLYFSAMTYYAQGDLSAAKARAGEYVEHCAERKMLPWMGYGGQFIAEVLLDEGDANAARRKLDEATALIKAAGDPPMPPGADASKILLAQDELGAARVLLDKDLANAERMGSDFVRGQVLVASGELAALEGRLDKAEEQIRGALELNAGLRGNTDTFEAMMRASLADVLLSQGKKTEARAEMARAEPLFARTESLPARLGGRLVAAQVHAADGDVGPALQQIDEVIAEAEHHGWGQMVLTARLAKGQVELAAGKTAAGRRTLAAVQRDARPRGFLLIARQAKQAAAGK